MNQELCIEVGCYDEAGRMFAVIELTMRSALDLKALPQLVGRPVRTIRINQFDRWENGTETSRMFRLPSPGVAWIRP